MNFISLLFGFSFAVSSYIAAFYFKAASGTENISVFFLIAYLLILAALLNLHKLIKSTGKSFALYLFLATRLLSIIVLFFFGVSKFGIAAFVIYITFGYLSWVGLDVVLESFSRDRMSGRIRGLYLTLMNVGMLFGPFVSTRILDKFDFRGVFLFLLFFNLIIFAIALAGLRKVNHRFERNLTAFGVLKKIRKRRNIKRIYYIAFILQFFYAGMIIYGPIYLFDLGISIADIGIIFTVMLLPFVFLQYPAGILADKKIGEKEMLIFSLVIMGLSTLAVYFISATSVAVWAVVLFITRIGAALIEILQDSYFYKRVDGHDVDIIDFFRTTRPAAYSSFAVLSTVLLLFFPLKTIFILVAVIIFSGLYAAFTLVDNLSEEEVGELKKVGRLNRRS